MNAQQSQNKQSFLQQALEISQKSQAYFAELGKKELWLQWTKKNVFVNITQTAKLKY
ncbi:MAG: hypothetical protein IKG79_02565 [Neisseriaceae bacterium]|nr:hypothetical protein [Neisseriaceae bacterium]